MEYGNRWIINDIQEEEVEKVAKEAGISRLLAKVFLSRGIRDADYIRKFLNASLEELYDPFMLKDMDRAVGRILKAISDHERILIYGDYDVDGVTSTSVLYDFLSGNKADISYFIPNRMQEGYGLTVGAIDRILKKNVGLIITVDCGITAFEEVEYINGNNVDIIITDHHECKECIPDAYAVINPLRPDCSYPFKELAGVGVVFKLVEALSIRMGTKGASMRYLDLVALGTVADVVPLLDENRVIVKHGLLMIESTSNIGLKSLIKLSGAIDRKITTSIVGFVLAPRINAAGRVGDAQRAVRLLTTDDEKEALMLSSELDEQNKYRKDTELSIWQEVENTINSKVDFEKEKIVVVSGEGWHNGVVGIVAARVTEKYNRPCILISIEDGIGKGSGRSIEGFNLFKALQSCESILLKYGGHELAAGLTLNSENIDLLRKMINEYADKFIKPSDLIPRVKIDAVISKEYLTMENVRELELLAPFGAKNSEPVFVLHNLKISDIRAVGQDKHIKIKFFNSNFCVDGIGFNKGNLADIYFESDVLDVACSVEINSWNNTESVQLIIKDLKFCKDSLMENYFFYSLDKCIDFIREYNDNSINSYFEKIDVIKNNKSVDDVLADCLDKGGQYAILAGSIQSLRNLVDSLDSNFRIPPESYRVFFGEFIPEDTCSLYIIANPDPEKCDFSGFDKIIIYGNWICVNYLHDAICGIDLNRLCIYNGISFDFNENEIVLSRQDMVATYQYIKSNYSENFVLEDLFVFARNVAKSYRIPMNYFKIKKVFQVFEELNLLEKSPYGKYGMYVRINDNKEKISLDNSMLFRSIKRLTAVGK